MFDSRLINRPLTHRGHASHFKRILQHALYHPGLLGALGTGSEEIIHEGRIYKA